VSYHSEILDLIPLVLIRAEYNKAYYSDLYSNMNSLSGGNVKPAFSHRDFSSTLLYMIENNFLIKYDDKKRGTKVYYQLTQDGKNSYQMGILRKDEKLKKLYQLLLFFECVTKMNSISKAGLDKALRYVNATEGDLDQESNTRVVGSNVTQITYRNKGPIKVQKIVRRKDESTDWYYYLRQDGLTVKEVMKFLKSTGESNHFLIGDLKYKRNDIANGIEQLRTYGLLKHAASYDRSTRYRINNDMVQEMIHELWHIHDIEFSYLLTEWNFRKPTEHEEECLKSLVGKQESQSIKNKAYFRRNENKKLSVKDNDIMKENRFYDKAVDLLIRKFYQKYRQMIKENHLYRNMIENVIIRPSRLS
jgi:hypothetical protein